MEYNTIMAMPPEEFFDRLKECFAEAVFSPEQVEGVKVKKHYVYGIQGLCDLLGCSQTTAHRIKSSGVIDAAIAQNGKTIVIDADLCVDLLKVRKKLSHRSNNVHARNST